ncbi:hypothetical protein PC115_g25571 [Phytophthora cactorum]|uniref:Uncharacterized protein n=1 Tax=Phytophthora cactorum TaxID=29920 RepID=A0A8T0ZNM1_9STRA|nr:hypothetical protein PC115_g25571 [Phytophthora cactorum]
MAVGSSRMSTSGLVASATAILSSCFCPPDSIDMAASGGCSSPTVCKACSLRRKCSSGDSSNEAKAK